MLSYQEFAANIRRHDQLHLSGETKERIQSLQPDQSCVICHQVQTPVIDKRFQRFWKWFYVTFLQYNSLLLPIDTLFYMLTNLIILLR